jgi:hypothetical protein
VHTPTWASVLLPLLAVVVTGVVAAALLGVVPLGTALDVLLLAGAALVGWSSIASSTGAGL